MAPTPMDPTLSIGSTRARAAQARDRYRMALAAVLLVEAAALLVLMLWPRRVADMLASESSSAALRLAAVAGLVLLLLLWTGRREPSRTKLVNLIGMAARFAIGLVLLMAGGMVGWAGAAEMAAAIVLTLLYFRYFEAEVTTRP